MLFLSIIFNFFFRFFSIYFDLFRSISIYFDLFRSISIYFDPFRSISIHFDPFRSISIYFDPFRSISIHFDLFRILSDIHSFNLIPIFHQPASSPVSFYPLQGPLLPDASRRYLPNSLSMSRSAMITGPSTQIRRPSGSRQHEPQMPDAHLK